MTLKINPLYQSALRPLTEDESRDLEGLLETEGCLHPILTCDGVIVDGHNRYEICERRGFHYDTKEIKSRSEDAMIKFIHKNNLARRNLTVKERLAISKLDVDEVKKDADKRKKAGVKNLDSKSNLGNKEERSTLGIQSAKMGVGKTTLYEMNYIEKHGTEEQKSDLLNEVRKAHTIFSEIKAEEKRKKQAHEDYKDAIKAPLGTHNGPEWAKRIRDPLEKIISIPLSIADGCPEDEAREIRAVLKVGLAKFTALCEAFGMIDKTRVMIQSVEIVEPTIVFDRVERL